MNIPELNLYTLSQQPSELLAPWLYHDKSLTDKLLALTDDAQLTLLGQFWQQPSWWDRYLLHITQGKVLQREILMQSRGSTYWYAKTIIPEVCYLLNPEFFKRLEQESLRNLIFDNPQIQRSILKVYAIDTLGIEWFWVQRHVPKLEGVVWARLIELQFMQTTSFYLLEVLLPQLEKIAI